MLCARIQHARLATHSYSHAALLAKSQPAQQQYSQKCIRQQLRELFRETAQPVAVVTTFMSSGHSNSIHHGATLSSFTSIAMDPFPLVTFALRIPSRMATSLNSLAAAQATTSAPASSSTSSSPAQTSAHMVINILASTQARHALVFSRPDLFPQPFSDPEIPYSLTQEGLPVLDGSLGSVSCRLVGRGLPLHDLDFLSETEDSLEVKRQVEQERDVGGGRQPAALGKGAQASELFIAQVARIEALGWEEGDLAPTIRPLLYHRRQFTTCNPPESTSRSSK